MRFTDEQLFAVEFPLREKEPGRRYLAIEAGAGAGKTAVVCRRISWLLTQAPSPLRVPDPARIVLVTFSRSAEQELHERVAKELAHDDPSFLGDDPVLIATIDGLFNKLLENVYPVWWEAARAVYPDLAKEDRTLPRLRIKDTAQAAAELEELLAADLLATTPGALALDFLLSGGLRRAPGGEAARANAGTRAPLLQFMLSERVLSERNRSVSFALQDTHPAGPFFLDKVTSIARREFARRLLKGEITHTDRTVFLHAAFCLSREGRDCVGVKLSPRFPLRLSELIVDEYQDTSVLQHEILFGLARETGARMVVVGDPKQSIYGFRNAEVRVFRDLLSDPAWSSVSLATNFRSEPTLLAHVNDLSARAFGFLPPAIRSRMAEAALSLGRSEEELLAQSHVRASPLAAGRIPADLDECDAVDQAENLRVELVTCSLDLAGQGGGAAAKEALQGVSFVDFQLWAIAEVIRRLVEAERRFKPSDVVILCETNGDVARVADVLPRFGLPVIVPDRQAELGDDAGVLLANRVALHLACALTGRLTRRGLFELLSSPLVRLPARPLAEFLASVERSSREPETREARSGSGGTAHAPHGLPLPALLLSFHRDTSEARDLRESHPQAAQVLDVLVRHARLARRQFFASWQTLRHALAESGEDGAEAALFCSHMDPFARALSERLDTPGARVAAEEAATVFLESGTLLKPAFPLALSHWRLALPALHNSDSYGRPGDSEAATCLTVHRAKGLEWPCVVIIPKGTRSTRAPEFSVASKDGAVFVKWLAEDLERLSVVSRKTAGGRRKEGGGESGVDVDFLSELDAACERQRVYYTAFTRAREHLILCEPLGRRTSRKGLVDRICALGPDDSAEDGIESTAQAFLCGFLDAQFDLRADCRKGAVAARSTPPETDWARSRGVLSFAPRTEKSGATVRLFGLASLPGFQEAQARSSDDRAEFSRTAQQPVGGKAASIRRSADASRSGLDWSSLAAAGQSLTPEALEVLFQPAWIDSRPVLRAAVRRARDEARAAAVSRVGLALRAASLRELMNLELLVDPRMLSGGAEVGDDNCLLKPERVFVESLFLLRTRDIPAWMRLLETEGNRLPCQPDGDLFGVVTTTRLGDAGPADIEDLERRRSAAALHLHATEGVRVPVVALLVIERDASEPSKEESLFVRNGATIGTAVDFGDGETTNVFLLASPAHGTGT